MKDTLTKENFWDEMEQKYPKAMEHFKEWLSTYKLEHDWDVLFKAGLCPHKLEDREPYFKGDNKYPAPKYHELPIAMQFGIFLEWLQQFPKQKFQVYLFEQKELKNYSKVLHISFLAIVKSTISRGLSWMEEIL